MLKSRLRIGIVGAVSVALALGMAGCGHDSKAVTPTTSTTIAAETPAEQAARGTEDPLMTTTTTLPRSAGVPDPCTLFTAVQVSGFVGHTVQAPKPSGTGQSCAFTAADATTGASVLLTILGDDTHDKFTASQHDADTSGSPSTALMGIGDEAFVYSSPAANLFSAESRKGTTRVRVVVSGPGASQAETKQVLVAAVAKA
jgi:hypothetical protein